MEKSQNALVRGRQLCAQLSIFEGSLAELLRFHCCQLQKVSLAELLRFWCQLQKLRKSCRIASFSMLSNSKNWRSVAEMLRCGHSTTLTTTSLHYTTTTLHYIALHYTTQQLQLQLHYNYTTTTPQRQLQLHQSYNYNYTTTALQLQYNYATTTWQLQLHYSYTTLD